MPALIYHILGRVKKGLLFRFDEHSISVEELIKRLKEKHFANSFKKLKTMHCYNLFVYIMDSSGVQVLLDNQHRLIHGARVNVVRGTQYDRPLKSTTVNKIKESNFFK